jgi:hypothetical protein
LDEEEKPKAKTKSEREYSKYNIKRGEKRILVVKGLEINDLVRHSFMA